MQAAGKVQLQESAGIRKGAWAAEEDAKLVEFVGLYGHGRWSSLAQAAGLQRTGKSCRLRWMNYLRPNVRHGGFSLDEQLLILQLHFRWGNRWAKIAEQLPGRTDNDIKNYWRTRILKHAKHLNCDVNSPQFKNAIRDVWIPTLLERITSGSGSESESGSFMGQPAHLPSDSPQEISGPNTGPTLCTDKLVTECGAVNLSEDCVESMGLDQAQNNPFGVWNGPDFGPLIFDQFSPSPWSACQLARDLGDQDEELFDWNFFF
ncbi:hypothetical protein V2J09_003172 [Rumex salicifolius]